MTDISEVFKAYWIYYPGHFLARVSFQTVQNVWFLLYSVTWKMFIWRWMCEFLWQIPVIWVTLCFCPDRDKLHEELYFYFYLTLLYFTLLLFSCLQLVREHTIHNTFTSLACTATCNYDPLIAPWTHNTTQALSEHPYQ